MNAWSSWVVTSGIQIVSHQKTVTHCLVGIRSVTAVMNLARFNTWVPRDLVESGRFTGLHGIQFITQSCNNNQLTTITLNKNPYLIYGREARQRLSLLSSCHFTPVPPLLLSISIPKFLQYAWVPMPRLSFLSSSLIVLKSQILASYRYESSYAQKL